MKKSDYQYGFSRMHPDAMFNVKEREQKAKKMIAVLSEHYSNKLEELSVLDIGCSTGSISNILSKRFRKVIGSDIDCYAIDYAKKNYSSDKLHFSVQDGSNMNFPDQSFDVAICAHVYEHVPDSKRLLSEIYRVLKSGGICYFAAGNRLNFIEPHYKLPLLSVIPRHLAHLYLRIANKGKFYYEKHLSLWGLRKLVSQFEVIDYTLQIVRDPKKYCATEMVEDASFKQKIALWILKRAYWLCPTYIWLLRKNNMN